MCTMKHDRGDMLSAWSEKKFGSGKASSHSQRRRVANVNLRPYTVADKLEHAERLVRLALRLWEYKNRQFQI